MVSIYKLAVYINGKHQVIHCTMYCTCIKGLQYTQLHYSVFIKFNSIKWGKLDPFLEPVFSEFSIDSPAFYSRVFHRTSCTIACHSFTSPAPTIRRYLWSYKSKTAGVKPVMPQWNVHSTDESWCCTMIVISPTFSFFSSFHFISAFCKYWCILAWSQHFPTVQRWMRVF